MEINNSV